MQFSTPDNYSLRAGLAGLIRRVGGTVLLAVALCVGCRAQPAPPPAIAADDHDHDHGHDAGAGPHGGVIADWGAGDFHVELLIDHADQSATVYILGSDEATPTPIAPLEGHLLLSINRPFFQVQLMPDPQAKDPPGTASRFRGTHPELAIERELAGWIGAEVDGVPYAGDFDETVGGHKH